MNLAANARDAMPHGGDLVITTCARDQRAIVIIADSGAGMSPETIERVFEPFFTTKEDGRGTGLGLSIVHSVVEQSGGTIQVTSEVGRGTTFTLSLPAYDAAAMS